MSSRMYEKILRLRHGKRMTELCLKLIRVVPVLEVEQPTDLALHFAYVPGRMLGVKEKKWKRLGPGISKSVPPLVLHQFCDSALFYMALKGGLLRRIFHPPSAEKIAVHLLASMPEVLVKYRFYLGFAGKDGDIDLVDFQGRQIRPTIADPYQRLFSLQDPKVTSQVRDKFGAVVKLKRRGVEYVITDKKNRVTRSLGFRACLETVIKNEDSEVRQFLAKVYKDVRTQEAHTGRLGDNVIFEVDDLFSGIVKSMNFLYTRDLDLPYTLKERGPFTVPFIRLAASRPLTKEKSLSGTELLAAEVKGTKKWYDAPT